MFVSHKNFLLGGNTFQNDLFGFQRRKLLAQIKYTFRAKREKYKNLENVFTKNSISAKLRHLKTNVFYRNNLILAIIKEAMINLFLYLSWPFED